MLGMTASELDDFLKERGVNTRVDLVSWLDREDVVLSASERDYLRAVIKPFRDKVNCIFRESCPNILPYTVDRIVIIAETLVEGEGHRIVLAPFSHLANQYAGMELGKTYTVEELGL